jgi:beta-propeller uncharacterized protein DUF5122
MGSGTAQESDNARPFCSPQNKPNAYHSTRAEGKHKTRLVESRKIPIPLPNALILNSRISFTRLASFDPNADSWVYSIAVQADGKVLAGGNFINVGGQPRNYIARLDATTGLPDSFNPSADWIVWSIAVQADSKILVGGQFTSIAGRCEVALPGSMP